MLGDSPDEAAFFRWEIRKKLENANFREVKAKPFDFLNPWASAALVPAVDGLGRPLERLPLLREIAGSLLIRAVK